LLRRLPDHTIDPEHIEYHNTKIAK
jgi:hypothetical protein